ncbi:hypothetical protein, partial [Streptomyces sp. NRRL S-350]|uniref:hypothetical protein n=1 Tax=Streptomyces sp. NRRL S-350 TaxID=1463902 RepID=UPI001F27D0B7
DHRDLHYPLRRQRQMCIRDSHQAVLTAAGVLTAVALVTGTALVCTAGRRRAWRPGRWQA